MVDFTEKQQEIDEFPGFTVYDAETGEPASVADAVMEPISNGIFAMNENGDLIAVYWDTWRDVEAVVIPKQGNYVVRFADSGKYLRW